MTTINKTTRKKVHPGNGVATEFGWDFYISVDEYVKVLITEADGTRTVLDSSAYTVSNTFSETGGTVTYPRSGSPLPSGDTLTIYSDTALTQLVEVNSQNAYNPSVVMGVWNKLTVAMQELKQTLTNTVRLHIDLEGPIEISSPETDKVIAWDASGNLVNGPTTTDIANAGANATAAAVSAALAQQWASEDEDVIVSGALYSAYHYMLKAQLAKQQTETVLDSFDDRYLGAKAADPTVDNDGNALIAGALYYNTTDNLMKIYDGSAWASVSAGIELALRKSLNLSDLENIVTARNNLGLGDLAVSNFLDYYNDTAEWEAGLTSNYAFITPAQLAAAIASLTSPGVPSGTVIHVAQNTAPTGYLKADGSTVSRTTYADLYAAIGDTFGAGDGSTTFDLPDLRGEFIRGWDDARGVDSGRIFGSAQADEFKSHNHTLLRGTGGGDLGYVYGGGWTGSMVNTNAAGGAETRPRNIALLACIKT